MYDQDEMVFAIGFYDKDENFLGYYAIDAASGGYPYISSFATQACLSSMPMAITRSEDAFASKSKDFAKVFSCQIGKLELTSIEVILRTTVVEQRKAREIEKRLAEIRRLQNEIEEISKANQEGAK